MTGIIRFAHAIAVTCVALLLGACAGGLGTSSPGTPLASRASVDASASSAPLARPLRNPDIDPGVPEILEPGTYVLDRFPVDLAFDIPDGGAPGWHAGRADAVHAIVLWYTPPEITYGFTFWHVDAIAAGPCDAPVEVEPPIGPSIDDLVAALSNLPGFRAAAPADTTVGAFHGKEVELTALESGSDCKVIALGAGEDNLELSPGETLRVQILDVDGVRIVTHTIEPDQRDPAVEAELQQILDSVRIEPLP